MFGMGMLRMLQVGLVQTLGRGKFPIPGCLGWDGKEPLGAGTFPASQIFGMGWEGATWSRDIPTFPDIWDGMGRSHLEQGHSHRPRYLGMSWEEKMDPGASLYPWLQGCKLWEEGSWSIPGSWLRGVNTGIRDIPTFPDIWDELGRSHWDQGHSHIPGCLGWDGKEPLGAGTFPPSQIFGNELGRSHWKQGHSHLPGRVIPSHDLEYSPSCIQRDEESPGFHSRVIPTLGSDTNPPGNVHYPGKSRSLPASRKIPGGKSRSGNIIPAFPEPGSGSHPSWNADFLPIFGNFFPLGQLFPLKIMD
ncbi:uncharacterized protein LOC113983742 isoform X6 [Pipra filicauda]|uniref:Uncharacterized protein LOC113983742 isoform X5 n=1 Tax=Pipra filicauda TaxID=649802 RepID=A0A7R5JZ14_9PASS|nr:uncharacterized protein LOC113983742 isoform X5 [Pipra filicauda]XP_039233906.1 uncharacterized protein LOC113983742 isoform X6 [Pipra filicauda]